MPRGVAPVAPAPDEERHGEARPRVHHHHATDQSRSLPDLGEQTAAGGRSRRYGRDRRRSPPRRKRPDRRSRVEDGSGGVKGTRQPSRYERLARDRSPRASPTCSCIQTRMGPHQRTEFLWRAPNPGDHARHDSQGHPSIAVTRMIQSSDTRVKPSPASLVQRKKARKRGPSFLHRTASRAGYARTSPFVLCTITSPPVIFGGFGSALSSFSSRTQGLRRGSTRRPAPKCRRSPRSS